MFPHSQSVLESAAVVNKAVAGGSVVLLAVAAAAGAVEVSASAVVTSSSAAAAVFAEVVVQPVDWAVGPSSSAVVASDEVPLAAAAWVSYSSRLNSAQCSSQYRQPCYLSISTIYLLFVDTNPESSIGRIYL